MTCDYCGGSEDVRHIHISAENICQECDARLTAESLEAAGGEALCREIGRHLAWKRECELEGMR